MAAVLWQLGKQDNCQIAASPGITRRACRSAGVCVSPAGLDHRPRA